MTHHRISWLQEKPCLIFNIFGKQSKSLNLQKYVPENEKDIDMFEGWNDDQ